MTDATPRGDLSKQRVVRRRLILASLAVVCLLGAGTIVYREVRWKRFAVVEEGKLYRSGELKPGQLQRAIQTLGLKTVVCLHEPLAASDKTACEQTGAGLVVLPMPSDGSGTAEQFARFLELARDPARQPLLVHCQAGVARTGAAIALYRVVENGWSVDAAINELRSFERKGRIEPELAERIRTMANDSAIRAAEANHATPMSKTRR